MTVDYFLFKHGSCLPHYDKVYPRDQELKVLPQLSSTRIPIVHSETRELTTLAHCELDLSYDFIYDHTPKGPHSEGMLLSLGYQSQLWPCVQCKHASFYFVLLQFTDVIFFYKLKAKSSISKKITTYFIAIVLYWCSGTKPMLSQR